MSLATADERYFVSLVNQTRADLGLAPLRIARSLNESADAHSRWMLDADVFSHSGARGSSASARIEQAGFPMYGQSWGTAENLAYVGISGGGDLRDEVRQLHRNLMDSPSHYENIVSPRMEYIGIGLEVGNFQGHTVLMATQNFGRTTGQPALDTGLFPVTAEPALVADVDSRGDWLDEVFDGAVRQSSPGGRAVEGTAGADDFRLGATSDLARGGAGDDWMAGGAGHDTLYGGAGHDRLIGGLGADLLVGGNGNDTLDGQRGDDRLVGGNGHDLLRGGAGNDTLTGGAGHDTLLGGPGNDRMDGGAGFDYLHGGPGSDTLRGGAGNDTLIGARGNDLLVGGSGRDTFVFHEGDGADRIADYQPGIDRLLIDDALMSRSVAEFYGDVIRETSSGVVLLFGGGDRIALDGRGLTAEDIADDIFLI
ncbi:CAP domain-containing protein [Paracoccus liaowanqingii]|nr:CAP domain-containing protein [Paracoccus liaowanqingii]